jgi:two-component system, NtrC family, sensor kinase
MHMLRNVSITKKLMLLVLAAVALALALSHSAFIYNDVKSAHSSLARQLSALAAVLGSNSEAALTFDDSDSAQQILASLRRQPTVESACIYDAEGKVFASYSADGLREQSLPMAPPDAGHRFTDDSYLDVSEEIRAGGERIGVIYLHAALSSVHQELAEHLALVAVIMMVSFLAALLLASRLQRTISAPILALGAAAQRVAADNDYSIRVEKIGNDELGSLYDEFNSMLEQIESSKRALQQAHDDLERRVTERTRQLSEVNKDLSIEVTERRRTEKKLEEVHQELLTSARRAGMAEIATGVLHNVGNVLNSVNVSANTLNERLRASKRNQLDRLVTLLDAHRDDLGEFVSRDDKGRQIPAFLKILTEQLRTDEETLLEETRALIANVDHIKTIVSTQQAYAGVSGVIQSTDVNELLGDAIRLNSSSFERHEVTVIRDYAELPPIMIDKQRVLQIVINLVKNAKESLMEQREKQRQLTLRTRVENDRLVIQVSDTGVGIKPEDLTKIFSHGFTTKKTGHGFGLHSCANAATEMNGCLTATSDGLMTGATFTLSLPLTPGSVCA